jgi:hypothetical protein
MAHTTIKTSAMTNDAGLADSRAAAPENRVNQLGVWVEKSGLPTIHIDPL